MLRMSSKQVFRANLPAAWLAPSLIILQPSARHGFPYLGFCIAYEVVNPIINNAVTGQPSRLHNGVSTKK